MQETLLLVSLGERFDEPRMRDLAGRLTQGLEGVSVNAFAAVEVEDTYVYVRGAQALPEVQARLAELRVPSRAEPGCIQYDLHRDRKDADLIYMIEQWRDEAALAEHEASEHFQAFVAASRDDLAELDIRLMNRID